MDHNFANLVVKKQTKKTNKKNPLDIHMTARVLPKQRKVQMF